MYIVMSLYIYIGDSWFQQSLFYLHLFKLFSPISEYVASEKDEQLDAKDTLDSESKTTREVSSQK